jgi:hypothetical protein
MKKKYDFVINMTDQIFYILLNDKQILLSEGDKIPPLDQIKGKQYCKMHN